VQPPEGGIVPASLVVQGFVISDEELNQIKVEMQS
jgi:hypothetical protein